MAKGGFGPTYIKRQIRMNSIRKRVARRLALLARHVRCRLPGPVVGEGGRSGERCPVKYSERLEPGETLVISHIDPS